MAHRHRACCPTEEVPTARAEHPGRNRTGVWNMPLMGTPVPAVVAGLIRSRANPLTVGETDILPRGRVLPDDLLNTRLGSEPFSKAVHAGQLTGAVTRCKPGYICALPSGHQSIPWLTPPAFLMPRICAGVHAERVTQLVHPVGEARAILADVRCPPVVRRASQRP